MDASMTQIECPIHSPEYVQNFSCRLHKKSPNSGSKSFSAEFSLRKEVNDVRGAYVFSFKQGKSIINYTAMEIDYCQALSALQSQILFKLIADELRRVSNFPLNCPFVMNKRYYVDEFTINPKVIPSYTPEMIFTSDCNIFIKKRRAMQLTIHGRVVRR
uniref:Uncharacterized protein n=1 Tax=Drosophila melanogaster TaxID=7227 RepID=Q4ABF7_DROME|nr:uncharacterized protein Dmel_CG33644 [Drosophila melanogaster]AAZ66464.1 uncharacterized protein Dmel_CG33644 [Drosophila melanogaster]|eukprot:NP_001027259.1 uncharacterized protein Dmel_CG33644 [Drosophila melanogaster]